MKRKLELVITLVALVGVFGIIAVLTQDTPIEAEVIIEEVPVSTDKIVLTQTEYDEIVDLAYLDCRESFSEELEWTESDIALCFIELVRVLDQTVIVEEGPITEITKILAQVEDFKANCSNAYQDPELIKQCEAGADMMKFGYEMPIP